MFEAVPAILWAVPTVLNSPNIANPLGILIALRALLAARLRSNMHNI